MVIHHAVLLEVALVQTAGHHRLICAIGTCNANIPCIIRVLHAHVPRRAVFFRANQHDVTAQIDNAALAAGLHEEIVKIVGNKSFRDAA